MATNEEYQALIDSLSGECERLHKENEELKAQSQEPCDDAISRDAAITIAGTHTLTVYETVKALERLPSVTKSGKWIEQEGWDGDVYYECSMCGEAFCLIDGTPTDNMYNYCPNCGAKMESEDKE